MLANNNRSQPSIEPFQTFDEYAREGVVPVYPCLVAMLAQNCPFALILQQYSYVIADPDFTFHVDSFCN